MITFTSETANKNELKNAIWEELIKCTMNVVGPLYGDYEEAGFNFSEDINDADKRRIFATCFLEGSGNRFEILKDSVVLYDNLNVDDTSNDDFYDLETFANAIKTKFPDVIIQGEGFIDYGCEGEPYRIYTEGDSIVYECVDEEDFFFDD